MTLERLLFKTTATALAAGTILGVSYLATTALENFEPIEVAQAQIRAYQEIEPNPEPVKKIVKKVIVRSHSPSEQQYADNHNKENTEPAYTTDDVQEVCLTRTRIIDASPLVSQEFTQVQEQRSPFGSQVQVQTPSRQFQQQFSSEMNIRGAPDTYHAHVHYRNYPANNCYSHIYCGPRRPVLRAIGWTTAAPFRLARLAVTGNFYHPMDPRHRFNRW
ncbi:MAG: hypothetical protein Q8N99_02140 [Nanoarchaeota archaeon]|nr:hypothetical protein [Nanoarchaeota archaeon]